MNRRTRATALPPTHHRPLLELIMRIHSDPTTPTPYRDLLLRVLSAGLALGLLIVVITVVAYWPLPSLLVYGGLVLVAAVGAAVEAQQRHLDRLYRARRQASQTLSLPAEDSDHPEGHH
jgi:hypothetical protein